MHQIANNSPELLRQSILADARKQADEILQQARQREQAILAEAAANSEKARQDKLAAARAHGVRQRTLHLARLPVEISRRRSTRVEGLLRTIHDEANAQLASLDANDRRAAAIALAADALKQMAGEAFVVRCAPQDKALLEAGALAEELRRQVGRVLQLTLVEDETVRGGGVILQDADGRRTWDNRFSSRLARLWPALRLNVAIQTGLAEAAASTRGAQ